jgi:hypothetical protein
MLSVIVLSVEAPSILEFLEKRSTKVNFFFLEKSVTVGQLFLSPVSLKVRLQVRFGRAFSHVQQNSTY